ncbi:hypothetical protein D3C72_2065810 [compost metagenome]
MYYLLPGTVELQPVVTEPQCFPGSILSQKFLRVGLDLDDRAHQQRRKVRCDPSDLVRVMGKRDDLSWRAGLTRRVVDDQQ